MLILEQKTNGQTIAENSTRNEFTTGDVIWTKVYINPHIGYVRRPRYKVIRAINYKDGQRLILEDYNE